jgi:hypothetical protein
VEAGDIEQKRQASLTMTGTRTLPRVTTETPETVMRWAKTWKRATTFVTGFASLNLTRTRTLPHVIAKRLKMAMGWAKNMEMGASFENGQALLNYMRTRMLPRFTAETPGNG